MRMLLFGSRTDDARIGGDIALWFETKLLDFDQMA
jgi:hypothetical protein